MLFLLVIAKAKPFARSDIAGTTVKGAVDDLDHVIATLKEVGYTEDRFYIHVDGALFGLMMPFVKKVRRSLPVLAFILGCRFPYWARLPTFR